MSEKTMSEEDVLLWHHDLREPSPHDKAAALRLYQSIKVGAAKDAVRMMTKVMMITAEDRMSFDDQTKISILLGVARAALMALMRSGLTIQGAGDYVLDLGIPAEQIEAVSGWKGGK